MLGISGTELVIILFFGFLIFGPEKLPQMGRTIGRAIRQFRQASDSMNKKFQDEVKDPFEEAVAPVRDAVNEAGAPIREDIDAINNNLNDIKSTVTDPFKDAFNGTASSINARPASRPANARPASVSSGGTAPAAAAATAAATTASAAKKPSPAATGGTSAPEAGDAKALPEDEPFSDPFAGLASVTPKAEPEPVAAKPKAQPLPQTGGTVKKSLAASLYDLDDENAAPASTAAAANSGDGE